MGHVGRAEVLVALRVDGEEGAAVVEDGADDADVVVVVAVLVVVAAAAERGRAGLGLGEPLLESPELLVERGGGGADGGGD